MKFMVISPRMIRPRGSRIRLVGSPVPGMTKCVVKGEQPEIALF